MDQLTQLYRNKAIDLQKKIDLLEKKLNESVSTNSPFFSMTDVKKEFTTSPMLIPAAKAIGRAVSSPVQTAQAMSAAKATEAAKATGKFIGTMAVVGAPAYYAGEYAGELADPLLDKVPGLSKEGVAPWSKTGVKSAIEWGAMEAVGRPIANALMRAPLTSGLGTSVVSGSLAGFLAPAVAYGSYKTGEAIGNYLYGDMNSKESGLEKDIKTVGGKLASGQAVEEPSQEKLKLLDPQPEQNETTPTSEFDEMSDEEIKAYMKSLSAQKP